MKTGKRKGFTLAELLVALAILGQIAVFTIPKVLNSQQNSQKKAIAKEAAAMLSGAFQQYQLNNTVTNATSMNNLTQYMNYVSVDTGSAIDSFPGYGSATVPCSFNHCLRLHNGALLLIDTTGMVIGYIDAILDADGKTTGPNDSIAIMVLSTGRITSFGQYGGTDPTWFSW